MYSTNTLFLSLSFHPSPYVSCFRAVKKMQDQKKFWFGTDDENDLEGKKDDGHTEVTSCL